MTDIYMPLSDPIKQLQGAVIAGTHSGCGKTTVTLGIMAALKKKGLRVQPFKAGPDFIDSGLHKIITGRHSRNLDMWMCGEDYVKERFYKNSQNADISIIEGVMGLYDGDFSTSRLAALLDMPVVLVIDAYGMAESAGAIVKGFSEYSAEVFACKLPNFQPSGLIAGVIFNRVGSERHYERLKNSVHDVLVLGYLPRDLNFEIPRRHLGLTVAEENPIAEENIERLADAVLMHVDIDFLVRKRGSAEVFACKLPNFQTNPSIAIAYDKIGRDDCLSLHSRKASGDCRRFTCAAVESGLSPTSKIAVAYDKAFCFYYEDNLDLLKDAGAEIITFSPLADKKIPDGADAVYIGGGYPELYAKELSGNRSMLKSIKEWSDAGRPFYAECGGLMYLSKGIYDLGENFFAMADVLQFETQMKKGRPSLGYREIELSDDCILGKKGEKLRGHEFHYSEIKNSAASEGTVPDLRTERSGVVESGLSPSAGEIYSVRDNHGEFINSSGYRYKNTLASYVHLHFGSNPGIAQNFINFIMQEN